MRGNPYLSRPVGSNEPSTYKRPARVVVKPVYIGQRPPTIRFVPGFADPAKRFIREEELYVPRGKRR